MFIKLLIEFNRHTLKLSSSIFKNNLEHVSKKNNIFANKLDTLSTGKQKLR